MPFFHPAAISYDNVDHLAITSIVCSMAILDMPWGTLQVGKNAVVVEADAIKTRDIVFKQLAKQFQSDASLSQFVHEYSTKAAESMLVAALNQQKDIVFDGTMTWLPFVEQTIGMARDYRNNYRRSVGYSEDENGHVTER